MFRKPSSALHVASLLARIGVLVGLFTVLTSAQWSRVAASTHLPQGSNNCINCHNTAQNDDTAGPIDGRRDVTDEFTYTSHHVSGTLANADCLVCHQAETSGSNHKNGLVQLTDPDNAAITYTESSAGAYRPEGLTGSDLATLTSFCLNCHDTNGAARLGTGAQDPFGDGASVSSVGTHSNQNFSGVEADFFIDCVQCHASHGSNNLALIHSQVVITPNVLAGPVIFTAQTGSGSRDDGSGNGICVICHTHVSNPGYPMVNHSGGIHTRPSVGDQRGNDCTTCHPHDPDHNPVTQNGHMPANTNAIGLHGILAQGGLWPVVGLGCVLLAFVVERRGRSTN